MSGRGLAALSTNQKVDPAIGPLAPGLAVNGDSIDGLGRVVLGQDLGDPANPAILLSNREIPFDIWNLVFSANAGNTRIVFTPIAGLFNMADNTLGTGFVLNLGSDFNISGPFNTIPLFINWNDTSGTVGGMIFGPDNATLKYAFSRGVTGKTVIDVDPGALSNFWGFQQLSPLALIHIADGNSVGVDNPSLIIDGGPLVATIRDGAIENDASNLNFAVGGTRYILAKTLTGTAILDFPNTAAGTSSDLTIAVAGAADGDPVSVGVPASSVVGNGCFTSWVSAPGTVTVRFTNNDLALPFDPAPGNFRVSVIKY